MQMEVEKAILRHLDERGPCTIEELIRALSRFTFNQVFSAVDRLSLEGKVRGLRHPTESAYHISATGPGTRNPVRRSTEGRPDEKDFPNAKMIVRSV